MTNTGFSVFFHDVNWQIPPRVFRPAVVVEIVDDVGIALLFEFFHLLEDSLLPLVVAAEAMDHSL